MKPDEILEAMLLEFGVTFAAKKVMRPIVEEKGKKQGEILKKAMDKENPLKDLMDMMKEAGKEK